MAARTCPVRAADRLVGSLHAGDDGGQLALQGRRNLREQLAARERGGQDQLERW